MKIQPNFTGNIKIVSVQNKQCTSNNYKTFKKYDKQILKLTDTFMLYNGIHREPISAKNGRDLCKLIEKATGTKLNLSKDCEYSYKMNIKNIPGKNRLGYQILLIANKPTEEKHITEATGINILI